MTSMPPGLQRALVAQEPPAEGKGTFSHLFIKSEETFPRSPGANRLLHLIPRDLMPALTQSQARVAEFDESQRCRGWAKLPPKHCGVEAWRLDTVRALTRSHVEMGVGRRQQCLLHLPRLFWNLCFCSVYVDLTFLANKHHLAGWKVRIHNHPKDRNWSHKVDAHDQWYLLCSRETIRTFTHSLYQMRLFG